MKNSLKLTYVGHSTILLQTENSAILTDPLFVNRILVVKRKLACGLEFKDLPHLDCITISHAHTDHLNLPSLKNIKKDTPFIVPPNVEPILEKRGFTKVTPLENWKTTTVGDFTITSLPVNHAKGRFFPWQNTGVASYIFQGGGKTVLVAGDVDFGPMDMFKEIGEKFEIDMVLLPVGGMRNVDFYNKRREKKGVHIDPETAYEAFKLLKAKMIIPIHWGAITIAKTARDEAPLRLKSTAAKDGQEEKVKILYPGESWS
jgi:L-ascorbate metabolism protein UlaG (beta-lactamase superfamily)